MRKAIGVIALGVLGITFAWAVEQKDSKKAIHLYAIPKNPNRFIIRIPQAPKPLMTKPGTDLIQKPEKKELPR